jgi:hypothetical protein
MQFTLLFIIIIIMWFFARYIYKPLDKNPYYSEFDLLISNNKYPDKILNIDTKKINKNDLNKNIIMGKYKFKIKEVEVVISKDEDEEETILNEALHMNDGLKQVIIYIEYKNNIETIKLTGKLNDYRNLDKSELVLDYVDDKYYNLYYNLSIKQIYIHETTLDWYDLIITINRITEENIDKDPLTSTAFAIPIRNNLLNPNEDLLYKNTFRNKTPARPKIDTYGIIDKKLQDPYAKIQDTIIKTLH